MDSLELLRDLADYNYWARDRQLEACARLTEEQFVRPLGGSFPSIRDTLAHLLSVEWIWLERWRGKSPRVLIAPEEFPAIDAVAERWQTVERGMREYLAGLTEDALAQPLTYISIRGDEWTYPLRQQILHLFNHQSFHRGQVTNHFRMLGVPAPAVDFLVAQDARRRGSVSA